MYRVTWVLDGLQSAWFSARAEALACMWRLRFDSDVADIRLWYGWPSNLRGLVAVLDR